MSSVYGKLPHNLPLLQNMIKRDPTAYKEEFLEQYQLYKATLAVFNLQPQQDCTHLVELVSFISQVAQCYPKTTEGFPLELISLLQKHASSLHSELRMGLCKSLVLLRNKKLVSELAVLQMSFGLLTCRDKELRKFLFASVVANIQKMCTKNRNMQLNTSLQNYLFSKLEESHVNAPRTALMMMISLYRKNVWNNAKVANVIASTCFSPITKVMITAIKFLLGSDDDNEEEEEDSEDEGGKTLKEVMMAYRVAKKSKKRKKQLERAKSAILKDKKKKKRNPTVAGFSAIQLLYDPQTFAEKLFKRLSSSNDRFEVKICLMGLIAKTVGIHQLMLLNFYPFLQRYIQPHQREVTKILLFAAQAAHELVPPDVIETLVRTVVNNFVTERNSVEVMTVGINAVREILHGCPFAISDDLLQDLTAYKSYKNKNVVMAARSLIQLYRGINPTLLHRKDRGKPTEFTKELKVKEYGEVNPSSYIPGAECLPVSEVEAREIAAKASEKAMTSKSKKRRRSSDSESEWIDLPGDDSVETAQLVDEEEAGAGEESIELDSEADDNEIWESESEQEEGESSAYESDEQESNDETATNNLEDFSEDCIVLSDSVKQPETKTGPSKEDKAALVSSARILTDEDFRRIKATQIAKRLQPAIGKKGQKRKSMEPSAEESFDLSELETTSSNGLPKLADIEKLSKRPKQSKEERLATIMAGREGREKFGRPKPKPHVGKTNRKKRKQQPFQMVKHKIDQQHKKRTFRDKQIALRKHLMHLKKLK